MCRYENSNARETCYIGKCSDGLYVTSREFAWRIVGFIWNVLILCDIVDCEDISAFMDKLFFNIRLMLGGIMTETQQKAAAKKFAAHWKDKGYEKGQSQTFWLT